MTTAKNITMKIDEIKIGTRHRKDMGDLHGLARRIGEVGLLHPPVVRSDGELIAGQRRVEACKLLGLAEIPVRVVDMEHIVFGEQAENLDRKDFTIEERVAIGREIERVLGERRGRPSKEAPAEIPQEFDGPEKGKETAVFVAKAVGFGNPESYRQAQKVIDAAARHPEKHGEVLKQMNRTGRVGPAFMKITGKSAGNPNGKSNGGLWDHEAQELVQNFSDFEWGVLSAISPTVRTFAGFDDLDALDDDSWDALQTSLIEAKRQIDAFIQKF
jgi:ParB family chromosome partitioning protein